MGLRLSSFRASGLVSKFGANWGSETLSPKSNTCGLRGGVQHGAVGHVGVSCDPATIGCAEVHILRVVVKSIPLRKVTLRLVADPRTPIGGRHLT